MTEKKNNGIIAKLRGYGSFPVVVITSIVVILVLIFGLPTMRVVTSPPITEVIPASYADQPTDDGASLIVLGEYTSSTQGVAAANQNLMRACDALNGVTIGPGETFSFNSFIAGQFGNAIYGAEAGEDHDCSMCQLASTMYIASLKSGYTVTERHAHSSLVGYVPMGLDAWVHPGTADLKIVNTGTQSMSISIGVSQESITLRIIGYPVEAGRTYELISNIEELNAGTSDMIYHVDTIRQSLLNGEITNEETISTDEYPGGF